jgi:sodium/proline symporter
MIIALVSIVGTGLHAAGGVDQVIANVRAFPGFLEFFGMAQPVMENGAQAVIGNVPQFEATAAPYDLRTIVSTLSWGLGYFGMPQVLLRFMAIRHKNELKSSRRIATVWVFISLFAAVAMGIIGRALYPTTLSTAAQAESILIVMSTNLLPAVLAGLVMAGILAATISSSDSYLLIASSAAAKNIYHGLFRKNATDKQVMTVSRITLLAISVIAALIATDENSIIFQVVSFAWAGFGATFGPIMLFSLFWKRVNRTGAIAGMVVGGSMVFIWKLLVRPLGGVVDVYELLPAFLLSCLAIIVVSLLTKKPSAEIQAEFEHAKAASKTKEDLTFAAAKHE